MAGAGGSQLRRWAASGALGTAIGGACILLAIVWIGRSCSQSLDGFSHIGEIPKTGCADSASPMIRAAAAGDVPGVQRRLASGTDPDAKDDQGNSALACAGPRGHVEVVALLLDHDAIPNTVARDGDTVLSDAVRFCQPDVARLLLAAGASPDQSGRNRSPIDDALDHGDAATVQVLLDGGADVSKVRLIPQRDPADRESTADCPPPTDDGRTASLQTLLDAGADPSTVLGGAAEVPLERSRSLIDAALAAGADPTSEEAGPVVAVAAGTGDADLVARLLAAGADPNLVPEPPIDIDRSATATTQDPEAQAFSDLWDASWSCPDAHIDRCDVTSGLIQLTGADAGEYADQVPSPSQEVATSRAQATAPALLVAAWRGDADVVRVLLAGGADLGAETRFQGNVLQAAAASGDAETVALLLAAGAEPAAGQVGGEASSRAAAMGHEDLAKVLRAAGN